MRPLQGKVAISIVPRYFELSVWRSQVDDLCGLPMIDVAPPALSFSARVLKRTWISPSPLQDSWCCRRCSCSRR